LQGANPETSPGAIARLAGYGQSPGYYTYTCFGGLLEYVGDENVYNVYQQLFADLGLEESSYALDLSFNISEEGDFVLEADVELAEDIINQNNKIFFALTNHNHTNYSATVIAKTDEFDLDITESGETATITGTIPRDQNWNVRNLRAVAIIQSWDTKEIYQSAQVQFTGLIPGIISNIQSGPASLQVRFTNNSMPSTGVESFQWDFDGDGIFDSDLENPIYIYDEPGTYDVTLQISANNQTIQDTWINYISVNSDQTASGAVSGVWRTENSPYTVIDSIIINLEDQLVIEPGVEVFCNDNAEIHIQGAFIADAADGESINFTSENSWQGLYFEASDSESRIINCRISNCSSSAIYIEESEVVVVASILINNTSYSYGAALNLINSADVEIRSNIIANNCGYNAGSIIYLYQSSPLLANNIIVNNSSQSYGSIAIDTGSNAYLLNNTIANNYSGIASLLVNGSFPLIRNCLIWEQNDIFSLVNGAPSVSYSCISGGYNGIGNLDTDPQFHNPSTGSGNVFNGWEASWILNIGSPCTDAGNTDEEYNDMQDPNNPGFALFPARGTIINDIGAFGGDSNSYTGTVDTDENELQIIPGNMLHAYPNPFNPQTAISFFISEKEAEEEINLDIYNVRGQIVKSLHSGYVTAGNNYFIWNACHDSGRSAGSGIFFAKLNTAGNSSVVKLLLIK